MKKKDETHSMIICLGCNLPYGGRQRIEELINGLGELGTVTQKSGIYTTAPYGASLESSSRYHNAVVFITTPHTLEAANELLKETEKKWGRDKDKDGCVSADMDIFIFDGLMLRAREENRDYFRIGYQQIRENVQDNT